jgi:hypothetical protein
MGRIDPKAQNCGRLAALHDLIHSSYNQIVNKFQPLPLLLLSLALLLSLGRGLFIRDNS